MEEQFSVYDIGSTYTKLSVFSMVDGTLSFEGRGQSLTTLDDVMIGVAAAKKEVESKGVCLGARTKSYATCSAAGGLRMIAMGFMPRVTAKAAKEVAMCAGARVLEVVSHEDRPEFRLEILREISPDIVLLAGGTDGGNSTSVLENAEIIVKSQTSGMVIIACNQDVRREAKAILEAGGVRTISVPNLMPTVHKLHVTPCRQAIHSEFIRQITKAKGLNLLIEGLSDPVVMPTPGAVLLAAELLGKGTVEEAGAETVLIVDIGGATTDIHSVVTAFDDMPDEQKGLVVSNEKQLSFRTVEGNLGMRVSATGIVETMGTKALCALLQQPNTISGEMLEAYAQKVETYPNSIPETPEEENMDTAMAIGAGKLALKRHAGYYAQEYDPVMGIIPGVAVGRDLRSVRHVIGVGGIFAYRTSEEAQRLLSSIFDSPGISLVPICPDFFTDENYILYALGALGRHYPHAVVRYMKDKMIGKRE